MAAYVKEINFPNMLIRSLLIKLLLILILYAIVYINYTFCTIYQTLCTT